MADMDPQKAPLALSPPKVETKVILLTPTRIPTKAELQKEREEKKHIKDEETRLRTEEKQRVKDEREKERKRKEEERLKREAEAKQKAEERQREKDEREKERKRKEEERLKKEKEREEEAKRRNEERLRKEAEKKEREDARNELKRQREQEQLKKDAEKRALEEKEAKRLEAQQKCMRDFFKVVPKPAPKFIERSDFSIFSAYEVQEGVRMAPVLRVPPLSPDRKEALYITVNSDFNPKYVDRDSLYIGELKRSGLCTGRYLATCAPEVTILSATKAHKPKLIQFSENSRPPYYGTMRRKSSVIRGRKPFAADAALLEYEVDSDEEWEEEQAAGEADECDEDEDNRSVDEGEDDASDWLIKDEDELNPNEINNTGLTDDEDEIGPVRPSVHDWIKQKKFLRLKRRVIGPCWGNQENECPAILRKLSIIPIAQEIGNELRPGVAHESLGFGLSKIPEKLMPYFIRLLHGSYAKKEQVTDRFLELLAAKDSPNFAEMFLEFGLPCQEVLKTPPFPQDLSKSHLKFLITKIAEYTRPSDAEKGVVRPGRLWYVHAKVRDFYKVLEGMTLPNPSAHHVAREAREKRKASEMDAPVDNTPSKAPKLVTGQRQQLTPTNLKKINTFFRSPPTTEKKEPILVEILDD